MSRRKTIVVDARMILSSGIGRYLRTVLAVLKGTGARLIALGDEDTIQSAVPGVFDDVIRYGRSVYDPRSNLGIPLLVPECDLYYSPHFTLPAIRPRAKRVIVTIHDLFHLDAVSGFGPAKRAYSGSMIGAAVRNADLILVVSNFTRRELLRHFRQAEPKIRLVPNCVDRNTIYRDETEPAEVDSPFALFVGNLKPHKNLVTAIAATGGPGLRGLKLVVVGAGKGFIHGPDRNTIERLPESHVIRLESVDDSELRRLYSAAACLVFPSLYEGFGLPPLEAMACGCPVVSSDIPALRETCADAALYCDPLDVAGFRSGIERAVFDPVTRAGLIARGEERVGHFSFGRFSENILRAFGECL